MLDPTYSGYIGDATDDKRKVRGVPLGNDKAAVNAFIARHHAADKVVISIGTAQIAHVLIILERGVTVHGSHHEGIGTSEVLAWQEDVRRQQEVDEELRWAEDGDTTLGAEF
ncbi:hypothetical protein HYW17_01755 [Candidatus Uhrbacteria bacterium]|nr:hypothetical protein [Candidatus Uhrbacteria bacterium]